MREEHDGKVELEDFIVHYSVKTSVTRWREDEVADYSNKTSKVAPMGDRSELEFYGGAVTIADESGLLDPGDAEWSKRKFSEAKELEAAAATPTVLDQLRKQELPYLVMPREKPPQISRPPGSRLVPVLSFVLPKRVYEQVIQQHIADMREDYFATLAEGRPRKAEWDAALQRANIVLILIANLGASIVDRCIKAYGTINRK